MAEIGQAYIQVFLLFLYLFPWRLQIGVNIISDESTDESVSDHDMKVIRGIFAYTCSLERENSDKRSLHSCQNFAWCSPTLYMEDTNKGVQEWGQWILSFEMYNTPELPSLTLKMSHNVHSLAAVDYCLLWMCCVLMRKHESNLNMLSRHRHAVCCN